MIAGEQEDITGHLHARLRAPATPSTVPGSLPVLFFGDLWTARVATVGINPSRREYQDRRGQELDGADRRFETLASLGAPDRSCLTDAQCERAIVTMRAYFDPGKPVYAWFAPMTRVVRGLGHEYGQRQVAHLDLVQEATDPTWSALLTQRPEEARALVERDTTFLRWQIDTFPLRTLVCNGRSVFERVVAITGARIVARDRLARVTWSVALGQRGARPIAVVGWNIPLSRPAGLTAQAHVVLGERLRACLRDLNHPV